ncbi:MAG TPA: PIN domain-containing protein [Vitreimonas sp.]|uniref:PIN domain-containing protein n=1 Tax=Vitreimonas sp. TaxID=3069702 RepID=UPI002D3621E6|nr:PIN domain-containing protein [Vitreimonas sp.]HYD89416.1 PIN domain-containing protein [Vitreimonas sp.]
MRILLDTDVVVRAFRSPESASAALIKAARTGRVTLIASLATALEYEAVLGRAEIVAGTAFAPEEGARFARAVASLCEPVIIHRTWRPRLRDPNDEHMLEAALNGRAEAIVTFNRRDLAPAAEFGLRLVLPRDILAELETNDG